MAYNKAKAENPNASLKLMVDTRQSPIKSCCAGAKWMKHTGVGSLSLYMAS